ncbi:MAG: TIGR01212 family radical SAM protein [Kosmotoga sp.]|nr:MAG: TIGR01212 family radical SAM protein [Kosmotoga sp.]
MNYKKPYNDLKSYLKKRYGEYVYRLPIDAGFTCPNRDGTKGTRGCIYCDSTGSGFSVDSDKNIKEQVNGRKTVLRKRGINKFIAYFQVMSNTYAPVDKLDRLYSSILCDDIVILDVSTRPDLAPENVLNLLESYKRKLDVMIEFGLQTSIKTTLRMLNRKHDVHDFIDAVIRAKNHELEVVAHVIVNLPWDNVEDVIETSKLLSSLNVDGVKIHSLYVVEDTPLGHMYNNNRFSVCTLEEYIERVIIFLEYLSPEIVIHRLASDPPREGTIIGNWGLSKIEVLNKIHNRMKEEKRYQGKRFSYLNR